MNGASRSHYSQVIDVAPGIAPEVKTLWRNANCKHVATISSRSGKLIIRLRSYAGHHARSTFAQSLLEADFRSRGFRV